MVNVDLSYTFIVSRFLLNSLKKTLAIFSFLSSYLTAIFDFSFVTLS